MKAIKTRSTTYWIRIYCSGLGITSKKKSSLISKLKLLECSTLVPENEISEALDENGPLFEYESDTQPCIEAFINSWLPCRSTLLEVGVLLDDYISLHVEYYAQCNLDLSLEDIACLSTNELSLTIDCWRAT